MAQTLSVRLLGQFQLSSDGAGHSTRPNRSPRLQSLVAYLILHRGAPVPRAHLAYLLWPDSSEPQALTNLRNLVHQLRAAIDDPDAHLRSDTRTIAWHEDSPASVDVADFEDSVAMAAVSVSTGDVPGAIAKLKGAADSYRGDLLPGCYEDWVEADRERLRQLFLEAMDRLVRLLASTGDAASAIPYAQRLVRYDPLHEDGYRHLLELFTATGDRVAARRTYQSCTAVLERELDVEPSPTTRMAFERSQNSPPPESPPYARTPTARRVPLVLSSFVGRQGELASIARSIASARLVTLTGAGGAGKTRLALEVAGRMASEAGGDGRRFGGRVWWVDLAPVLEPSFVGTAFLNALEATRAGEPSDAAAVAAHLQGQPALLVVDNCEHVIDACADLVGESLALCPALTVFATSREPLGVPGEMVLPVRPLPLPPRDWKRSAHPAEMPDAMALFAERAASALPTFVLDDTNSATVAAICRRVDGLPLAIELAAAAVRVLSVNEIASRIEAQIELPGRLRGGPARHRTLRDAIEWSYSRLSDTERDLFGQVSVFAGLFSLSAFESVCVPSTPDRDLLDLLAMLADKSLVVVEERGGRSEYRLLESLRTFARGALDDSGTAATVRARHASWCLDVVETEHPKSASGGDEARWLNRVERAEDDIRAAMSWAASGSGGADVLARLATKMMMYWNIRERRAEARMWLERVLALGDAVPPTLRALTLREAGGHAINNGEYDVARRYLEQALEIHRSAGNLKGQAGVLVAMSGLASNLSRYDEASRLAAESLELYRALDYPQGMATCMTKLGYLDYAQGRYASAHVRFDEALELRRRAGQTWLTADALTYMAELAVAEGDYTRALELCDEIEPLCEEVGDAIGPVEIRSIRARARLAREGPNAGRAIVMQAVAASLDLGDNYLIAQCHQTAVALESLADDQPAALINLRIAVDHMLRIQDSPGLAECLELAARLAAQREDYADSVRLYATAGAWRREVGAPPVPAVAALREQDLASARSALGNAGFDAAEAEGTTTSLTTAAADLGRDET